VIDVTFTLVILGFFALTLGYAAWCVGLVDPFEADPPGTGTEVDDSDIAGPSGAATTGRRTA
jgi:hypothetical protein